MLRVEPELKANYVAAGLVSLAFSHVLDHGSASKVAHQAAECAGRQQPAAFWHMHDLLFERQHELWRSTPELLTDWATTIGLDGALFTACLDDQAVAEKIDRIDQTRRNNSIRIRPSFMLNERLVEGGIPYQQFEQIFAEMGVQ